MNRNSLSVRIKRRLRACYRIAQGREGRLFDNARVALSFSPSLSLSLYCQSGKLRVSIFFRFIRICGLSIVTFATREPKLNCSRQSRSGKSDEEISEMQVIASEKKSYPSSTTINSFQRLIRARFIVTRLYRRELVAPTDRLYPS